MNVIIYGFQPWMEEYEMKDICFFLLTFAVMLILQGRMIERNQVQHQYFQILRYGRIGHWWNQICRKTLFLSVLMVIVLFCGIAIFNAAFDTGDFQDGWGFPILLWCLAMISVGHVQLFLSLFPKGLYVSFVFCVGIEVLCMYAGSFMGDWAGILPGSYMMLRRTALSGGFMPIWTIVLIDVLFIMCVRTIGYRILKRSDR